MFRNYFKTAFRNLRRNKVYAFINIVGLSLGLACAMLIMLYVKDEVSYDRFVNNAGNIYRVANMNVKPNGNIENKNGYSGFFQGPKFTAAIPEIKSFVRYQQNTLDLKNGTEIKSQEVFFTDSSFFNCFSFPLLSGNRQTALKEPNSVVISEDMARTQFGTVNAIGKTILFKTDGKFDPYVVTAVAKRCPQNSSIRFEVLMPIQVSKEEVANNENWFNFFLNTFVVLTPGANMKAVEAKMKNVYESDAEATIKMVAKNMILKIRPFIFCSLFSICI